MTDVISDATAAESVVARAPADGLDEQLVQQLSERARAEGLRLTGEDGLLSRLTKMVVESALEGEMEDHLGYRHRLCSTALGTGKRRRHPHRIRRRGDGYGAAPWPARGALCRHFLRRQCRRGSSHR